MLTGTNFFPKKMDLHADPVMPFFLVLLCGPALCYFRGRFHYSSDLWTLKSNEKQKGGH